MNTRVDVTEARRVCRDRLRCEYALTNAVRLGDTQTIEALCGARVLDVNALTRAYNAEYNASVPWMPLLYAIAEAQPASVAALLGCGARLPMVSAERIATYAVYSGLPDARKSHSDDEAQQAQERGVRTLRVLDLLLRAFPRQNAHEPLEPAGDPFDELVRRAVRAARLGLPAWYEQVYLDAMRLLLEAGYSPHHEQSEFTAATRVQYAMLSALAQNDAALVPVYGAILKLFQAYGAVPQRLVRTRVFGVG